jgi:hypothetical protein
VQAVAGGNGAVGPWQVSVPEAARLLGISERAVRWRIQAGQLAAERGRGGWRVTVDAVGATAERGSDAVDGGNGVAELAVARAVLAAVEAERDHLRAQLVARTEAEAELRRLLALALQRPALPAASTSVQREAKSDRPWWARWWPWRRGTVEA